MATIVRMSTQGADLANLWNELSDDGDDRTMPGRGMDLSVLAQLKGDKQLGIEIQQDMLELQQTYCSRQTSPRQGLRVLALAAASDIGANTPIDFLLEGSDVQLAVCYILPGKPFPDILPDHDVAIVIAPTTNDGQSALAAIEAISGKWPRALVNHPSGIRKLERDALYKTLRDVPGLVIPQTTRIARAELQRMTLQPPPAPAPRGPYSFPIIVRPVGSHAGVGLERIDNTDEIAGYLQRRPDAEFFWSPFIDYASKDGLFRKYRIVIIGGRPFAVHLGISDEWKVWYASADMAVSVDNRVEEAVFMQFFDEEFGLRHGSALTAVAQRVDLDYVAIDCAETRDGKLLIFEADNCAIVHNIDPVNVFPYKNAQMHKIFDAFIELLERRAGYIKPAAL